MYVWYFYSGSRLRSRLFPDQIGDSDSSEQIGDMEERAEAQEYLGGGRMTLHPEIERDHFRPDINVLAHASLLGPRMTLSTFCFLV